MAVARAVLLTPGLLVVLVRPLLLARSVSRPVEELAKSARRIEAGDYSPSPVLARGDEIGALSAAFATMAQSIRDREADILFQAGHDPVTGLPNRVAAVSRIEQELSNS